MSHKSNQVLYVQFVLNCVIFLLESVVESFG